MRETDNEKVADVFFRAGLEEAGKHAQSNFDEVKTS